MIGWGGVRNRMVAGNREEDEDLDTMLARLPTEKLRAFADYIGDAITRKHLDAAAADSLRAVGFSD